MQSQSKVLSTIRWVLMLVGGNVIYALAVRLFLLPANLMSSGTTGLALVVNHLTGFPLSSFILIFNVVMLFVGLLFLGKKFFLTTVVSSLLYPVLLEVFSRVFDQVHITDNMMLNTLFAGMGLGLALGIVIRSGASTGGVDIPLLILQKRFRIPISVSLYVVDFCIVLAQLMYHTLEDLLYGVLLLLLTSFTLNQTMYLGASKTELKIVSKKHDEIRAAIISDVDRGVTLLRARGGYSGMETDVVLSVVSNREMAKIERLVHKIDPEAFIIINRVNEVKGRGFSAEKKYR